jgi:histidine triad (HIT) family protein
MARCIFCAIVDGTLSAEIVARDEATLAFLDHRPLFPGHVLVVPRAHHVTLGELPVELVTPLFSAARRIARAVEEALGAEGTFVAMNNRVSQSVPHLHVHVVPRRKGDGLKGFFWPRHPYESEDERRRIAASIRAAVAGAG